MAGPNALRQRAAIKTPPPVIPGTVLEVETTEVTTNVIEIEQPASAGSDAAMIIKANFGKSLGGVDVCAFGEMVELDGGRMGFAPIDGHLEAFGAIAGRNGSSLTMGRKNGGDGNPRFSWVELVAIIEALGLTQKGRPTPKTSKRNELYVTLKFRK
jgi:hypothetical protein